MAYLVRRLLENTSNDSFLGDQQRGVDDRRAAGGPVSALSDFANEPVAELRRAHRARAAARALASVEPTLPLRCRC